MVGGEFSDHQNKSPERQIHLTISKEGETSVGFSVWFIECMIVMRVLPGCMWVRKVTMVGCSEHSNEASDFTKGAEFIH